MTKSNKKKASLKKKPEKDGEDANAVNKPRNLMVTDATTPVQVTWTGRFRLQHSVIVHQTAQQDTWPGGALWDMGWCLAQLLIGISSSPTSQQASSTTTHLGKSSIRSIQVPTRVSQALEHNFPRLTSCSPLILELGCGVGLSGLVAAAALQAKAVVLTDLAIVIDKVTQPNVLVNTTMEKKKTTTSTSTDNKMIHLGGPTTAVAVVHERRMMKNAVNTQVLAMPLCWGNQADEQAVLAVLESQQSSSKGTNTSGSRKKKGLTTHTTVPPIQDVDNNSCSTYPQKLGMPDLILIGDVAFQQEPGAPSHFDALVSTLMRFVDSDNTLVMFGTRIRMPASVDLLEMLLEHLEPVVAPAITADEIEPLAFSNVKHNMSIHLLRKRKITTATRTLQYAVPSPKSNEFMNEEG